MNGESNADVQNEAGNRYSYAIQLLLKESDVYWQTYSAFLVAHGVFLAFLLDSDYKDDHRILAAAVLGFILCIPWIASLERNRAKYKLRMEQAKAFEPKNWNLLAKDGADFAEGKCVVINGQCLRMPLIARILRSNPAARFLILVFAAAYVIIGITSI